MTMTTNFKRFDDIDLYDYPYQKGVEECDIPKSRKARIALCKKSVNNKHRAPVAGSTLTE